MFDVRNPRRGEATNWRFAEIARAPGRECHRRGIMKLCAFPEARPGCCPRPRRSWCSFGPFAKRRGAIKLRVDSSRRFARAGYDDWLRGRCEVPRACVITHRIFAHHGCHFLKPDQFAAICGNLPTMRLGFVCSKFA